MAKGLAPWHYFHNVNAVVSLECFGLIILRYLAYTKKFMRVIFSLEE